MGVEKNRQLSKPARRDAPPSVPRRKSSNELHDVKAKLVSTITELHSDVQRLELSSLIRKCKIGNLLLALKSLAGHGSFESEFERLFGDALSFRQAQRYIQVARSISLAMPLLRARLKELRVDLNHDELTDDQVLRELKETELLRLIDNGRASSGKLLGSGPSMQFSPKFVSCIEALFAHIDCILSIEPIDLKGQFAREVRVGPDPLQGITEWPKTILAISDASKEGSESIREVCKAFNDKRLLEALCIVPAQFLTELPELFTFPEVLLSPPDIFLQPRKGKVISRYLVAFLSDTPRHSAFLSAFSALGIIKFPVPSIPTES